VSDPSVAPERLAEPSASDKRIWTLPNILSFIRLATVPFFIWLFASGREEAAVILYGAGAWTDFFDGYLARKLNAVSELGKLLDPLADRVFIIALVIALVSRDALPLWLALGILIRDAVLLVAFPLLERRGIERVRVNFTGKTATASLLFGLTLLAWGETSFAGARVGEILGMAFTIFGAVLYWVAAGMYAREAIGKLSPGRPGTK
jgi:cardiolipin synthase